MTCNSVGDAELANSHSGGFNLAVDGWHYHCIHRQATCSLPNTKTVGFILNVAVHPPTNTEVYCLVELVHIQCSANDNSGALPGGTSTYTLQCKRQLGCTAWWN